LLSANDDPVDDRQTAPVYTLGLRVFPTPDVMLRASLATGVVPPAIAQLARATMRYSASEGTGGVVWNYQFGVHSSDPKRRGALIGSEQPLLATFGGSPTAERARSVSVGLVATPRAAPGLRFSIDYTRIVKTREPVIISGGGAQYFLDHEALYPERVIRAPLTDADRARGYTAGVVTSLDTSAFSIGETISEAVDFQFDYRIATRKAGDLRFSSSVTWQPLLRRHVEPYNETLNAVGDDLEPLAWRGTASAEWSRGPWLLGLAADFYDHYRVARLGEAKFRADQWIRFQGSDRIASQIYFDLVGAYRVDRPPMALARSMEVRFGVRNVLDRDAPVVANEYGMGYSPFADPRGRRFDLTLLSRL
jgi:outer membrane receptor protein involved in Fe transport